MPTVLYNMADLHIDGYPWSRREEFYGDPFRALESATQTIINDSICPNSDKKVMLGGDITDKRAIEDDTAMALRVFVGELYAHGIDVYYINGNHDMSKNVPTGHIGVFGGIHINKQLLQIGDFTVYGLDWMPRTYLKNELTKVPACDILYIHCAFEHLLSFKGAFDLTKEDIPPQVKNVFVGDVHVTKIVKNSNGTLIVSPGPLHPCDIAQAGPHGMMRISSEDMKWKFIPIDTRHVLDYGISDMKDRSAEDIAADIIADASMKKLIPHCVLRYKSDDTELADRVMSLVRGKVHIHDKKSNTGHLMTPERKQEIMASREDTTLEKEAEAFASEYPDVVAFVQDLLVSPHPEEILAREYNKYVLPSEQIPVSN